MASSKGAASTVEPFALTAKHGIRFGLLHRPPPGTDLRGKVLYVHPFAEEMNKSRRMVAAQARMLASLGYAVILIDLFGCGDSSGEMRDATVCTWQEDLEAAAHWANSREAVPLTVWGLRFGALLAVAWAAQSAVVLERLLLWQPVLSGEIFLTQFLRVGVAADLIASGKTGDGGRGLRKRLQAGQCLEIGGYEITPQLAVEMERLRLAEAVPRGIPVDWIEVTSGGGTLPPAAIRVVEQWSAKGQCIRSQIVQGDPFWATVEITDCPVLLETTKRTMNERWWLDTTSRA